MPPERFDAYESDQLAPLFQTDQGFQSVDEFWNSREGSILCRPGTRGRGPAHDLGRFYEALLRWRSAPHHESGFLITPRTARNITSRQRVGMNDKTFQHVLDWGLGFLIDSKHHGHSAPYGYGPLCSEGTFGHSGAQSSCAFADPAHDLVVVWICNGLPGELRHQERARAINQAVYQDIT
jgi:CubicO group peptidase (beta-lactamase class C family)